MTASSGGGRASAPSALTTAGAPFTLSAPSTAGAPSAPSTPSTPGALPALELDPAQWPQHDRSRWPEQSRRLGRGGLDE